MKKNGFTLAEVLITLALIGVVAALTLPNLMQDTTMAQIGPKLAKAVAMFEQANEALLNDNAVDSISDAGLFNNAVAYGSELSNNLKISRLDDNRYLSKDGMSYTFNFDNNVGEGAVPHKQRIGDVIIDINGNTTPNEDGTDIFYFSWWNDGSLRPKGATNWDGGLDDDAANNVADAPGGASHWTTQCANPQAVIDDFNNGVEGVDEDERNRRLVITDYSFCTGHIFENNLKVFYN